MKIEIKIKHDSLSNSYSIHSSGEPIKENCQTLYDAQKALADIYQGTKWDLVWLDETTAEIEV